MELITKKNDTYSRYITFSLGLSFCKALHLFLIKSNNIIEEKTTRLVESHGSNKVKVPVTKICSLTLSLSANVIMILLNYLKVGSRVADPVGVYQNLDPEIEKKPRFRSTLRNNPDPYPV